MRDDGIAIRLESSEEALLRAEAEANGMNIPEYVAALVSNTLTDYAEKAVYGNLPFVPNRPSKGRE